MKKSIAPRARKENLVVQELDGEVLIYDLNTNKAFCLNETSSLVWQLCNGNNSVSEISESISRKLDSSANEDLVWPALDQFRKENLIANGEEIVSDFVGMSRREVVKKVGLGTMIALPVISSLIAPTAVNAQQTGACPPGSPNPNGAVAGSTVTPNPNNPPNNANQCQNRLQNRCCSGMLSSFSAVCSGGSCSTCQGTCA